MTIVMRPSCWHQNFGPNGLSAPAQGLCLIFFSTITAADFNISSAVRWAIQDQWSSGFIESCVHCEGPMGTVSSINLTNNGLLQFWEFCEICLRMTFMKKWLYGAAKIISVYIKNMSLRCTVILKYSVILKLYCNFLILVIVLAKFSNGWLPCQYMSVWEHKWQKLYIAMEENYALFCNKLLGRNAWR